MEPKFPGVAIGLDHFRLACHVAVIRADVAPAHEWLEVRAELHAVGRVDVDHLHLPAKALVLEERVHDDERVAEDQPVRPVALVLVRGELLVERELRVGEELELHLPVALMSLERLEDRLRREPFVDEERQRRHVEGEPLGLAGPVEERLAKRLELASECAHLLERLGLEDPRDQLLPALAGRVLPVPVERRRER